MEIERKFLVSDLPAAVHTAEARVISQGYIAVDANAEVRVRRIDDRHLLTVKGAGDLTRVEQEFEIEANQFAQLWPLTSGRRVEKTRRVVPLAGSDVEIDRFEGDLRGLTVAEVEFETEAAADAFDVPDWFGDEVTFDPRFKNAHLAMHGRPAL